MFALATASALALVALQSSAANTARTGFNTCIREAAAQAKKDKVPLENLVAQLRQACEGEGAKLKAALVAFDVKNGVSRKQAASDADLQLDDYYVAQEERYRYEIEANKPREALAAKPADPSTPN